MTRFFTKKLPCVICGEASPNGWLWACTQDREMYLEDEEEKGVVKKFDALDDIFKAKSGIRSPSARQRKTGFWQEVNDAQLETYSFDQVSRILNQREFLLQQARIATLGIQHAPYEWSHDANGDIIWSEKPEREPDPPLLPGQKPWLPVLGGECKVKFCHTCKPHSRERSWLSLGGIADGDLPREAIHGFSFRFTGQRTVASARVVANLGLRPNPTKELRLIPNNYYRKRRYYRPAASRSPSPAAQGLGISGPQSDPSSSQSQVITSPSTGTASRGLPTSLSMPNFVPEVPARMTPLSPTNGSFPPPTPYWSDIPFPPTPTLTRLRPPFRPISGVLNIPLPTQTDEEIETISRPGSCPNDSEAGVQMDVAAAAEEEEDSDTAYSTAPEDGSELTVLTPMEEAELTNGEGIGSFSSEPLEVEGGVAVLEESVEDHIPDVITQY
ncbi:uncharacterized protein LY89DRAFT_681353 [Mollisia scopiformis]|uniref:Uncharacterized protein n=1 Tax=Mollisia scopiformis TaxID=149040 RepID=A0A194XP41_MOLSC|nr:uncharacterized protein LY89DRAFT_681353 [Mollisia scopiformis]KUJ22015.1 hypothetical protein LY89DRAFT_681353 [Mollisia scopiformis]